MPEKKKKRSPVARYLAAIGKKGGQAKVPKGLAMLTEEERKERARQGAAARWGTAKKRASKRAPHKKEG